MLLSDPPVSVHWKQVHIHVLNQALELAVAHHYKKNPKPTEPEIVAQTLLRKLSGPGYKKI